VDTRTYNSMGQVTNIHSGSMNITYNYSSTQNNGKITSQVDNLTGEQVTYAYDSLQRLISAQAGSTWGQGFAYDPFGNLTDKTALAGSVPTMHIVPDATTNHLGGEDANGNPPGAMDAENRLTITGTMRYAYDGQNKRVWSCTASGTYSWFPCTSDTYYFYGPNGKLMAQFTPVYTLAYKDYQNVTHPATFTLQNTSNTRAYFGGRMLGDEDRLGSRGGKYFAYGDDRSNPPPANDQVKFATYTRDSAIGLDYADQRYYASTYGRFLSPDRYMASGGPTDPGSWNRYAYARGDPVNRFDPSGLMDSGGCGSDGGPYLCYSDDGTGQAIPLADDSTLGLISSTGGGGGGGWGPTLSLPWWLAGIAGGLFAPAPPPATPACPSYTSKSGVFYTCFHQSGSDWKRLTSDLKTLDKRLDKDPSCEKFLTENGASMDEIDAYLLDPATTFTLAGTIVTLSGEVKAGTENDVPEQTKIIINSYVYGISNRATNFLTVLHELAHLTGVIQTEGPGITSSHNDDIIRANCSKTIGGQQ